MNYHSDEWIMDNIKEHYQEALQYFPEQNIVGIFYQGSANYSLDIESSDVDTKLITTPKLNDIIFNKAPISTTHVRENNEHIDFKDIRLYIQTFRKQNLNFLEILFTKYFIINPIYKPYWDVLVEHREEITHYNPLQAIKSMKGIAMEKFHAMEHEYPSKIDIIKKYGYDSKQLHHLVRVEDYIERYINGESYEKCLIPSNAEYLLDIKLNKYSLEEARKIANASLEHIIEITDKFYEKNHKIDSSVDTYLNKVQEDIMTLSIKKELKE